MKSIEIPNIENIQSTVEKIKDGKISIVALVKEHLDRTKETDKELNAFITILEDEAIARAKKLEAGLSEHLTSNSQHLYGIPFTVKDLFNVEDTKTTFGTKLMEEYVAPYTATVVQKCLDEGAILIGKTNCDPFGFGGSGENSGFGATKNPYDLDRSPGGSSSGSAASMAAGVGFFSIGTDTGGSVRQPAAMCRLYGYKPTYGRNSRYGISAMASSFDTPGFFARHMEDVTLLEEIMEGEDEHDATTLIRDSELGTQNSKFRIQNSKIGVPRELFGDGLNEEIKEAIENKIDELEDAGHKIVEIDLPSAKYALSVYYVLMPAEVSSNKAKFDGVRFGKKELDDYEENVEAMRGKYFEDEVKRRIMMGTYVLSAGFADKFYHKASKVRTKIKNEFKAAFEKVDVIVSPTSPTTAFKLGEKTDNPLEMYLADIYTVTANVAGIPAISIPIGEDSNGLPIGMQIMGNWWEDEKLFKF